jgi:EAL domain-containing protein (putative c-di-GMP-specific phosphodiesterase class I)
MLDYKLYVEPQMDYRILTHIGVYDVTKQDILKIAMPTIIDKASLALVTVKGDINNRIAFYAPYMTQEILRQQKVISEVDKALENQQICFYIQPQTDINGHSHGGEALVRWIDHENKIILPKDFVPILEEKGLISKVDLYIWDAVCKKLNEWQKNGLDDYYISVNISAKDMYYMDIYKEFVTLIEKYNIKPESLRLELTESAVMSNSNQNFETLNKLKHFGFIIEIDDFGSGYSSLNMLKDISFDVLKIDMVFLHETSNIEKSKQILKSIIHMAKAIGTDVITEGVETVEQLMFLNDAGCDKFQGYYFDKPLPVNQFEDKYLKVQK